jgi:mannose-6-phosphate isomerase-like protein (cupin superfamily)
MPEPLIVASGAGHPPISATGRSFAIHQWSGDGPDYLQVHYADDEAWHVLDGTLTFRFSDRSVDAPAGTTVFVPAGVPHTYHEAAGPTRYLIVLTPRLRDLIAALHGAPREEHPEILKRFESEVLE